jgi:anti-sigma regulatory factor (Ser/Thr protein kinase)
MAHLVRSCSTRLLTAWGLATDDPIVVLAELVANAAEHGGDDMAVRLHHCSDTLEIEVVDTGTTLPLPHLPDIPGDGAWGDLEGLRGRGLLMVAALSEHVLLRRETDGTTRATARVRATLLPDAAPCPAAPCPPPATDPAQPQMLRLSHA